MNGPPIIRGLIFRSRASFSRKSASLQRYSIFCPTLVLNEHAPHSFEVAARALVVRGYGPYRSGVLYELRHRSRYP